MIRRGSTPTTTGQSRWRIAIVVDPIRSPVTAITTEIVGCDRTPAAQIETVGVPSAVEPVRSTIVAVPKGHAIAATRVTLVVHSRRHPAATFAAILYRRGWTSRRRTIIESIRLASGDAIRATVTTRSRPISTRWAGGTSATSTGVYPADRRISHSWQWTEVGAIP